MKLILAMTVALMTSVAFAEQTVVVVRTGPMQKTNQPVTMSLSAKTQTQVQAPSASAAASTKNSVSAARGGTSSVGGGGNVLAPEIISQVSILNALTDSQMFIRAWLQGVENQIRPGYDPSHPNPRNFPIPSFAQRLFPDPSEIPEVYAKLHDLNVIYKMNSYCSCKELAERDGSVVNASRNTICISGFSLNQKLNKADFKVQVEALVLHELSHLMGANEDEAIAMQAQYVSDMQYTSKERLFKDLQARWKMMHAVTFNFYVSSPQPDSSNLKDLCKYVSSFEDRMKTIAQYSEESAVAPFPFLYQYRIEDLILHAEMSRQFVCGQLPSYDKNVLVDYKKAFQNKKSINPRIWMSNLGRPVNPLVLDATAFHQMTDVSEIEKLVQDFDETMDAFRAKSIEEFLTRFDVQIDDTK